MSSTVVRTVAGGRADRFGLSAPLVTLLVCVGVLAVGASLVSVVAVTAGEAWGLRGAREVPVDAAVGVSYTAAAGLVLAGDGGRRMGVLLLAIGTAGAGAALAAAVALLARSASDGVAAAVLVQSSLWVPGFVPLLTLVPLLYPDGRLPGPRWGVVAWASVVGMVLLAAGAALYPEEYVGRVRLEKPVTDLGLAQSLMVAAAVVLVPACLASVAALVARLRRSTGLVRRQVVVLLASAAVLMADTLLQPVLPWPIGTLSQAFAVALVPVAVGVAVTRHRLYDLDLTVCRSVGLASLAVCLAGVYLTVFTLVVALLGGHGMLGAALAAASAGVLVHPLGVRLARGVDRLFYGDRASPEVVLARLSLPLRSGLDLVDVPGHVCRELVASLRLGHAGMVLGEDAGAPPVVEVGTPPAAPDVLPLEHRGVAVGHLVVGHRPGENRLDGRDRAVLERVCDLVAPTVAALGLAARLQQSRAALVSAREEERMRLRRDLHDGMGAALAGLRLQVESAGDLVSERTVRQLLASAASGVTAAIDDLRGITEDLRPPALDDLGLATCLAVLAERLSTPSTEVAVDVDVPDGLPAAVEVACYRIGAEAMTNAVRHAGARRVCLELHEATPGLELSVTDDGHGLPERTRPGALGLSSMRARAEELGGSLALSTGADGTTVLARIPVEVA